MLQGNEAHLLHLLSPCTQEQPEKVAAPSWQQPEETSKPQRPSAATIKKKNQETFNEFASLKISERD